MFCFLSIVGPRFITHPIASLEVVINGDFMLTCSAEGFPIPSIEWFMNNTMITSGMTMTNIDALMNIIDSTLMISNAAFNDSGMFYCQAMSDEFGDLNVTSSIAIVTVVGKLVNDIELLLLLI